MSALEPGLYRATVRGVADMVVLVDDTNMGHLGTWANAGSCHIPGDELIDAHPLIVLDLDPRSPAIVSGSLVKYLREGYWHSTADQIEAQLPPARIPEPGLWGVVEAGIPSHSLRRKFVRLDSPTRSVWVWIDADGSSSARYVWDSLIDPTLIREGVES